MGAFATRQVILLPFPFSDLTANKMRPALVLAQAAKGDLHPHCHEQVVQVIVELLRAG